MTDYSQINRQHIAYHGSYKGRIISLVLVAFAFTGVAFGIRQSYQQTFLEPRAAIDQEEVVNNLVLRFETEALPKALVGEKYATDITVSSNKNLEVQIEMPDFPGVRDWGGECTVAERDGLFYHTCPFAGIPATADDYTLEFSATSAGESAFTTLPLAVFSNKVVTP